MLNENKIQAITKIFESDNIRTVWDKDKEKYYISVVDVVGILSKSKNSQAYWRKLKQRLKEEPVILVERKENMFENIFNLFGSIYTLNSTNFSPGKTGWSAEVVSNYDEEVIKEECVHNVFDRLIELDKNKYLKLYLYPELKESYYLYIDN